jgi:glutaredoxin
LAPRDSGSASGTALHLVRWSGTAFKELHDMPTATLYRMVLPDHECPFGVRAKAMLEEANFDVEEHILSSREEVESFKAEHDVSTTPQVFVEGKRIGGSDDLGKFLVAHG